MKNFKNLFAAAIAVVLFVSSLCIPHSALGQPFGKNTPIQLLAPTTFTGATFSNTIVDIHGMEGNANVVISFSGLTFTNANASATLQGSSDTTNWLTLSNAFLSTLLTNKFTNVLASGMISTNVSYVTTNTGPTNAAVVTVTATNATYAVVGLPLADCPRYLQLFCQQSGTNTTVTVGAVIIGRNINN